MVKHKTKVKMSASLGIGLGILTGFIITILVALIISAFVSDEIISERALSGWITVIRTIAAAIGCMVSTALVKNRLLMVSAITGGGYLLVLIALTALFFGGQYQGFLIGSLLIMVASLLCAFTPMLISKKRSKKHRKLYINR